MITDVVAHEFDLDSSIVKVEHPEVRKMQVTVPANNWKQSFRKTSAVELTRIIQENTITQPSLIRISGSYSTKMIANLSVKKGLVSGIESRPVKTLYSSDCDIGDAMNTDTLSYIPYAFNYLNDTEFGTNVKLYMDNFTLLDKKLYFTSYLSENKLMRMESIVVNNKDIIQNKLQPFNDSADYLKVFITDAHNSEHAIKLINKEIKEGFIFMVLSKEFNKIDIWLYKSNTSMVFNNANLARLTQLQRSNNSIDLYKEVKQKYEYERKKSIRENNSQGKTCYKELVFVTENNFYEGSVSLNLS